MKFTSSLLDDYNTTVFGKKYHYVGIGGMVSSFASLEDFQSPTNSSITG